MLVLVLVHRIARILDVPFIVYKYINFYNKLISQEYKGVYLFCLRG